LQVSLIVCQATAYGNFRLKKLCKSHAEHLFCRAVADPLAVGCKPVRVVVAVDDSGAGGAHTRSLPAAELPALAQRYAAKVCSMYRWAVLPTGPLPPRLSLASRVACLKRCQTNPTGV
jgi:hypothetical protein